MLPQYVEKTKADLREQIRGEQIVDLEDVFLDFTTRLMGKMAYDVSDPDDERPHKAQRSKDVF